MKEYEKKVFAIGPVQMFDKQMEIGGRQVPYFRNDFFSQVNLHIMDMIKKTQHAPEDAEVILLTCSGTGAMESALANAFDKDDRLLVIDGGSFGHRFTQMCALYGIPYKPVELAYGQVLTASMLEEAAKDFEPTGLLVNLHETSTGQLYDRCMLSAFCKRHNALLVVDAISAFLADPIDMERDGIDALIVSSQKALALAPGLSVVTVSRRMLEKAEGIPPRSMYLDWESYRVNGRRGQTPFTPAVRLLLELENRLEIITGQGVDSIVESTGRLAAKFREDIRKIGLDYPDFPLSNAETPVLFPDGIDAYEIYRALEENHGFVVNPSGGELGKKQFRVAHVGNHNAEDYERLVEAIRTEISA